MGDDVQDGPAGHRGGDLRHHLGHIIALGVAVPVPMVEEDTGLGSTISAIIR